MGEMQWEVEKDRECGKLWEWAMLEVGFGQANATVEMSALGFAPLWLWYFELGSWWR